MLGRIRSVRDAVGTAARYAATGAAFAAAVPAVATAGLVGESARMGARAMKTAVGTTAAVGELSGYVAKRVATKGVRAVGSVIAGGDPFPDGHVRSLAETARGMLEPPGARHTRRVWAE